MNRYLALDPGSPAKIAALHGKVLQVTVKEWDAALYLRAGAERLEVLSACDESVHCRMGTSVLSLISLGLARDGGESALGGDITMSGDMDAGRRFHALFKDADIDWEEVLAEYSGDIIAHQVGNALRGLSNWGRQSVDSLMRDVSEYLQQESRQLPTRHEIDQYLDAVDRLRLSVERAEARIRQLQTARKERGTARRGRPTQ